MVIVIYWKDFVIPHYRHRFDKNDKPFYNEIFCFDIEVTSFFYSKHKRLWGTVYTLGDEDCQNADSALGIPYIWQFNCNGTVIYGRFLTEFIEFLSQLNRYNRYRKYIFVHFLAYEFHFLMSHIHFDKVFARKPHIPMYAYCKELNCEFRCSYVLTNMGLAKLQENYNLSVTKKDGQLNYNIPRIPQTKLTNEELEYCEYDVIVLYELIKHFREKYKTIPNIPLTQTGEIRRVVKEEVLNSPKHLNRISAMYPNLSDYRKLTRVFAGGYTHANYLYNGELLNNVHSFDRASSYPAVMVTEQFPMSKFQPCDNETINTKHYCYIFYIGLTSFTAKSAWEYISEHKVEIKNNISVDNGRIIAGDYIEMWVTDIDLEIIQECYDGHIQIIKRYRAIKGFLPIPFITFILAQYINKCTLKGVKGKEDLYKKAKQFINALYGMCVTNDIRDDVIFQENLTWKIDRLSDEQISSKLNKEHFLNFAWGVYITAYARRELWKLINKIGNDVIYVDTDSVKFINLHENLRYITDYNKSMIERLQVVSKILDIPFNSFAPKSPFRPCGMPIGIFEYEGMYSQFKTFGAKKYAYVESVTGKFHFTVSGCIKTFYDWEEEDIENRLKSTIDCMENFDLKKKYLHGRRIMKYIHNQPNIILHDLQGNECTNYQATGIVSYESTYTMGLPKDYNQFLQFYDSVSTHNRYSSPFRCFF